MKSLEEQSNFDWWLRRADQMALAVIVVVCGSLLTLTVCWQIYLRGRWIDIERKQSEPIEFQVDLNRAPWPEIALLPGIGETVAREVVRFRNENGPFRVEADILRVPGIGQRTLERMRHHLLPFRSDAPTETTEQGSKQ